MSRRVGAFIEFDADALKRLAEIPQEMIERHEDMTLVMVEIATSDLKPDMISHLTSQGEGTWPKKAQTTVDRDKYRGVSSSQPGIGQHGGFVPTIQRGWSKRNAVAFTRAPHAHLFSGGTQQYRSGATRFIRFGSKAGRKSRAASRLLPSNVQSSQHQPPRPFDYISDEAKERSTRRVAAFLVEEPFRGSI